MLLAGPGMGPHSLLMLEAAPHMMMMLKKLRGSQAMVYLGMDQCKPAMKTTGCQSAVLEDPGLKAAVSMSCSISIVPDLEEEVSGQILSWDMSTLP